MTVPWTDKDERELCDVRKRHEALLKRRNAVLPGSPDMYTRPISALVAYQARRLRREYFPELQKLLGEPAWDILLDLHVRQRAMPVSSACFGADAPVTTALRVLRKLERLGLVERGDHPTDGRTSIVSPTSAATAAMERYLERVGRLINR